VFVLTSAPPIVQLFIAGVIPGVLSAFVYMAMITVRATVTPSLAP